jgi:hypothetical protein
LVKIALSVKIRLTAHLAFGDMSQDMRKILGFSVPPKLAEEFEALCAEEHRTKSEMFREMFRSYMYLRTQAGAHLLTFLERHGEQKGKT